MSSHKQKLTRNFRHWVKLNSTGLGVVVVSLVVIGGVIGLYFVNVRLSPSDFRTENGVNVKLQVTDHDNTRFLINSLTDNSQSPRYDDDQLLEIDRETSGRIPTLFRIQGNLTYR